MGFTDAVFNNGRTSKIFHLITPHMSEITGEYVADYTWLKEGRKYWNIWSGNPFCISLRKVLLTVDKEYLIKELKKEQAAEKRRFTKLFPDVKWVGIGQKMCTSCKHILHESYFDNNSDKCYIC